MSDLNTYLQEQLKKLDDAGLRRSLVPLVQAGAQRISVGGKVCLNLSGNDYLGIGADRDLLEEFYREMDAADMLGSFGLTASASRLMTGNSQLYDLLEKKLAQIYGRERALVFNSGYHGNAGILPALAGRGDLIVADKLCHASLIDGMRLSRAKTVRFRHLDYRHLEDILQRHRGRAGRTFIVSESIFSMDGDLADLPTLIRLKKQYDCILYLDEAHSTGVLGPEGLGLAEQEGVIGDIDLLLGTFGKALAGIGAYVICDAPVVDYLISRARPLLYSTALPPVCLNWLLFVLERARGMDAERNRLKVLGEYLRQQFADRNLKTGGNTQIIPVILGDNLKTALVAEKLRQSGYWVTAIRPPTVPEGTARLRLSLSATMNTDDLEPLAGLIAAALS